MKIGDSVRVVEGGHNIRGYDDWPDLGEILDITQHGEFHPEVRLHVAFNDSRVAYGFTREQLEYADA